MNPLMLAAIERVRGYVGAQHAGLAALVALLFAWFASCSVAEGGSEWATVVQYENDIDGCHTGLVTESGAALRRAGCYVPVGTRVCVEARSLPDLRGRVWYWAPSTACDEAR